MNVVLVTWNQAISRVNVEDRSMIFVEMSKAFVRCESFIIILIYYKRDDRVNYVQHPKVPDHVTGRNDVWIE